MSEGQVIVEDSVGQVVVVQKSPEQRGSESRAAYLRRSHTELARFFAELKDFGLTRHFTSTSGEEEEGEYYDFNKYGSSNGSFEGATEFRIVRQGVRYFLNSETVVEVGKSWETGRDPNSTESERFESEPKKLAYTRSEYKPKVDPPHLTLDRIEVSDSLIRKKGTVEEARLAHDTLNARLAVLRQKVNPAH